MKRLAARDLPLGRTPKIKVVQAYCKTNPGTAKHQGPKLFNLALAYSPRDACFVAILTITLANQIAWR